MSTISDIIYLDNFSKYILVGYKHYIPYLLYFWISLFVSYISFRLICETIDLKSWEQLVEGELSSY